MTLNTSNWPPAEGVTTPAVPREKTVVKCYGSTRIAAPASLVFKCVTDSSTYPEWNIWIPKVTIRSQPEGEPAGSTMLVTGTHFTYHVVMDASKPQNVRDTKLRVNDVSTPNNSSSYIPQEILDKDPCYTSDLSKLYRVTWIEEENLMAKALSLERFHEIIVLGEKECEVRTWECQMGVLSYAVNWMFAKTLMDKFEAWVTELKKFAEADVSKGI